MKILKTIGWCWFFLLAMQAASEMRNDFFDRGSNFRGYTMVVLQVLFGLWGVCNVVLFLFPKLPSLPKTISDWYSMRRARRYSRMPHSNVS